MTPGECSTEMNHNQSLQSHYKVEYVLSEIPQTHHFKHLAISDVLAG